MRPSVISQFTQFLKRNDINEAFKDELKKHGISYNQYCMKVEAIYAFRRIFNHYGDQPYAKLAIKWEDKVILDCYSDTIRKFTAEYGFQIVIKAIHMAQKCNAWYVPNDFSILDCKKDKLSETLSLIIPSLIKFGDEPNTPSMALPKLVSTSPKPKLPDTTPLDPVVTHNYDILDFASSASSSCEIDDTHILLTSTPKTHRIYFNGYMSQLIIEKGFWYAQFRVDRMLNKLYVVFTAEKTNGSVLCRTHSCKSYSKVILNSVKVLQYLTNGKKLDSNGKLSLEVSHNLANDDKFLTFAIYN